MWNSEKISTQCHVLFMKTFTFSFYITGIYMREMGCKGVKRVERFDQNGFVFNKNGVLKI